MHTDMSHTCAMLHLHAQPHAGAFSLTDVHTWIGSALPDLPPQAPLVAGAGTAAAAQAAGWRQCVLGTLLAASYKEGEAVFSR